MSDEVSIKVDGQSISGWTGVTIEQAIDNCADGFSISAPFDPDRMDLCDRFEPFSYRPCEVYIDDELIITGSIEKVELADSVDGQTIVVQGRNKTGVLVDCYIDEVGYQYNKRTLRGVIEKLIEKYDVELEPDPDKKNDTGIIQECAAEPGQKIFDFLVKLAEGYGLFLSSNEKGELVLSYPPKEPETPVASIVAGKSPYIGGSSSYDGTARFNRYTVIVQDFAIKPVLRWADDSGVPTYRHSVELGETTFTEREPAREKVASIAIHKRALALARAVNIDITVSGWRDANDALWEKGKTITLFAPALMVYQESPFILAGITLKIDESQGRVADLRLVMQQTYADEMPEVYPWSRKAVGE